MIKLLILGAGGHGKVVADIALTMGIWEEICFLDDRLEPNEVFGLRVIGKLNEVQNLSAYYTHAFVALGNNMSRYKWTNKLIDIGYTVPVIKHPNSIISKFASIGEGTVVMPGSIINASSTVGQACIINTNSSIDHDCSIGNAVHISPGVSIGGTVKIEDYTWICIGACIANNISIGRNSIVAAGSAVVQDITSGVLAAGVPAKVKRVLE